MDTISSRKVVEVLNRRGHCVSYSITGELETELIYEASKDVTPFGMDRSPDYGIGVAWDNYDRRVETSVGEATLHGTVGIAYQSNISKNIDADQMSGPSCSTHSSFVSNSNAMGNITLCARIDQFSC